jgi:hypothetical protein
MHRRADGDRPRAIGDRRAVERVAKPGGINDDAEPRVAIECDDAALVRANK